MTLVTTFNELNEQLRTLHEEFSGLRTTIRQDKPVGSVVFEDTFGDVVDDLLGRLEEGLAAAGEAQQAVARQIDLDQAWRALTRCQNQLNQIQYRFFELVSYERLASLLRFGRRQGGEWRAWSVTVKTGLERCWPPISQVNQALFQCWQEVAERAGTTSISVQTTSIGQQITVPEGKTPTLEGMT